MRTRDNRDIRADEKVDGARRTDVRTERTASSDPYAGIHAARERFGGIDIPASLVGMLTALSTVIILAGLVGAAFGVVGYQTGLEENAEDLSIGSLIGGIAILFVAYLIGGWAAGRIARYDGARNGFATGIWTLVFAGILAALGAWAGAEYDVFENVELPQWFDSDAFTTAAIISGVAAIAAMFIGGVIGGMWGERYHRRADSTIAAAPGGTVRTDEYVERDRDYDLRRDGETDGEYETRRDRRVDEPRV
ncbi:MAG TPA: TIGR04086 family membrane protein [Gaiellaceae bacterium]